MRLNPLIVEADQRSQEWFKARLGKVTGSKVAAVMAYYTPYLKHINEAIEKHKEMGTPSDIVEQLTELYPTELINSAGVELQEKSERRAYREGIVGERLTGLAADPEPYVNYDMKWGMASEPVALALYQLRTKTKVDTAPFMLHPHLKCGASPDGLIIDTTTGLLGTTEVKCLRSANHLYKIIRDKKVPEEYIPQIQTQLWISGRDFCDFVGFDSRLPDGLKIYIQRVPRDDFYIDYVLAPSVERFLDECDKDFREFWAKVNNKGGKK